MWFRNASKSGNGTGWANRFTAFGSIIYHSANRLLDSETITMWVCMAEDTSK
jgi:hypothetical protein